MDTVAYALNTHLHVHWDTYMYDELVKSDTRTLTESDYKRVCTDVVIQIVFLRLGWMLTAYTKDQAESPTRIAIILMQV